MRVVPGRWFQMCHEAWGIWQDTGERCFHGSRRRQEVLIFAEIAYDINHGDLAYTPALMASSAERFRRVVALPYTDEGLFGAFEGGQGVGDGGGDGEGPQRRLAETEVGYLMCQQAHCHANGKKKKKRIQVFRAENQEEEEEEERWRWWVSTCFSDTFRLVGGFVFIRGRYIERRKTLVSKLLTLSGVRCKVPNVVGSIV